MTTGKCCRLFCECGSSPRSLINMEKGELGSGSWLNAPVEAVEGPTGLLVTARGHSDFWRTTSYGFVHHSGHALLDDFPPETSVELSWMLDYEQQFDQAGLMVYSDEEHWIKAGVEYADGAPQLGAVVTAHVSDWSVAPVPEWTGKEVHLRISRSGDALTVRARCEGQWQLVRLAPLDPTRTWKTGLHIASPSREGLSVLFTSISRGTADESLH